MLNEVNHFIYEMESTYLKESNPNTVLTFIEKFYNDFIKKNHEIESTLLQKTANAIIVCTDTLMLRRSEIKDKWIYKTGENHILHQNRGNEIFDNLIRDILNGYVINRDVIRIVHIFLLLEVESDYRTQFIEFAAQQQFISSMNIEANIMISNLNRLKKPVYRFLYIGISLMLVSLFFTEIYYFLSLYSTVKSTEGLLNTIRSLYVI